MTIPGLYLYYGYNILCHVTDKEDIFEFPADLRESWELKGSSTCYCHLWPQWLWFNKT